jgi:hypothetical protein
MTIVKCVGTGAECFGGVSDWCEGRCCFFGFCDCGWRKGRGEADGGFCRTNSVGFVFEKWADGRARQTAGLRLTGLVQRAETDDSGPCSLISKRCATAHVLSAIHFSDSPTLRQIGLADRTAFLGSNREKSGQRSVCRQYPRSSPNPPVITRLGIN